MVTPFGGRTSDFTGQIWTTSSKTYLVLSSFKSSGTSSGMGLVMLIKSITATTKPIAVAVMALSPVHVACHHSHLAFPYSQQAFYPNRRVILTRGVTIYISTGTFLHKSYQSGRPAN